MTEDGLASLAGVTKEGVAIASADADADLLSDDFGFAWWRNVAVVFPFTRLAPSAIKANRIRLVGRALILFIAQIMSSSRMEAIDFAESLSGAEMIA